MGEDILVSDDDPNFFVSPEYVLKGIQEEEIEQVVVIGKLKNGSLYVAGSHNTGICVKLIEEFKEKLESGAYA